MNIKTLSLFSFLMAALIAVSAYAEPDDGNSFFNGTEYQWVTMHHGSHSKAKPAPKKLQKHFVAYSESCSAESKRTGKPMVWAELGNDRNRNETLESSELIPESGHCEPWTFGESQTWAGIEGCKGKLADLYKVGIDENLDGEVDSDEMNASLAYCRAEKPLTKAQRDALEVYENQGPGPGRRE